MKNAKPSASTLESSVPKSGLLLRDYFLEKSKRNPRYSLRALARTLGVSAPYLSQVLSGKKKLSLERATYFCETMRLTKSQSAALLRAVTLEKTPHRKTRAQLEKLMITGPRHDDFTALGIDRFKILSRWYHLPILDLTTTKTFRPDFEWVARRLKISPVEVRDAVQRLERLGFLKIENGRWIKTDLKIAFDPKAAEPASLAYHEQMIEKAARALKETTAQNFDQRSISGTTIAVNVKRLPEVKKLIQEFRRELASYLNDGDCTEVYQLNVQFFPLTKGV